jgi:hypothetical protein
VQKRQRARSGSHAEFGDVVALLREEIKHRQVLVDVARVSAQDIESVGHWTALHVLRVGFHGFDFEES